MSDSFQPGEKVLFFDPRGRTYLVTLQEKGTFHFHGGGVKHDEVLGQSEGVVVKSPKGATLTAVRPRLADFVLKMPRGAAVVYPKDIGTMLLEADIRPGDHVFEAGTGSGALCIALTRAVGETGRVVSYELREEHQVKAVRNIEIFFSGTPAWLDLRLGDGREVPDGDRLTASCLICLSPGICLTPPTVFSGQEACSVPTSRRPCRSRNTRSPSESVAIRKWRPSRYSTAPGT